MTMIQFAFGFVAAYKEDMDRLTPKSNPCLSGPCKVFYGSDLLLGNVIWSWGPGLGWYMTVFGCLISALSFGASTAIPDDTQHFRVN